MPFAPQVKTTIDVQTQIKGNVVYIVTIPSKVNALKKHPHINKVLLDIKYKKESIRVKVEHPFRIIKC